MRAVAKRSMALLVSLIFVGVLTMAAESESADIPLPTLPDDQLTHQLRVVSPKLLPVLSTVSYVPAVVKNQQQRTLSPFIIMVGSTMELSSIVPTSEVNRLNFH